MKRVKTALLGLTGIGEEFLRALVEDDQFELIAVADRDGEALRKRADGLTARPFGDYRSAIVESMRFGLEAILVALPPYQAVEFNVLAAERGIGVLQGTPWARTTTEARRLIEAFARGGVPLVVLRPWQSEPALSKLGEPAGLIGRVFAAHTQVRAADGPTGWRGDSIRAGGGVLLNDAYEQVDLLVQLMGFPETVFAQARMAVAPGKPRKYDTEDAMTVTFCFPGDRVGSLTAWRGAREPRWDMTLVGEGGVVQLGPNKMIVDRLDLPGPRVHTVRAAYRIAPAISAFGAAQRAGLREPASPAKGHLSTMAVIEAAYLSAKTASPESPERFLV